MRDVFFLDNNINLGWSHVSTSADWTTLKVLTLFLHPSWQIY